MVLVGDSLGMVIQGRATTLSVTLDDLIYHSQAVGRGLRRAMLMVDMPFLSFATQERALCAAERLVREGGAQIVKLEAGAWQADTVALLTRCGIPVCAHLGLQPQAVHKTGYRVQGRGADAGSAMLEDAQALVAAGADMLLLECVPAALAARITQAVAVPVIGIGAGVDCDGQILVSYDILDVYPGKRARFTKNFITETNGIHGALQAFVHDVKARRFPGPEHAFE